MGEVVKLQKPAQKAKPRQAKPRRRRPRRSRTALVLGGGGFTGGVYEIGALRALDLLAVNRTVNQFDVYVGTSAGSFVASLAANGVTPEEMMRVVNQQVPTPFNDVDRSTLMRPNALEFAQAAALLPLRMLGLARTFVSQARSASLIDLAVGIAEALPSGLYDGSGIQDYLDTVLSDPDRTGDFRLLENELFLTATDLDTCERIVLGGQDWDDVPISQAVAAVDRAADGLQARRDQGPPPGRRRPALDNQRRHRGRGGRKVRDRGQPRPSRTSTTSRRSSRRCSAAAYGGCATWASRRSATRPSS